MPAPIPTNPYGLTEWGGNDGYNDITGKVASAPTLTASSRLYICGGQSNGGNHSGGPYTVTNTTKIHNLNPYTGLMYRAADPLLGPTGNAFNIFTGMADSLTNTLRDHVVLIPIAIAGSPFHLWSRGLLNHRIMVAIKRARLVGMPVSAILWQGHESNIGTSQADYYSFGVEFLASIRALGCNAPILHAKGTSYNDVPNVAVRAAIDQLVAANIGYLAGPDTDAFTGPTYRTDGTHLTNVGRNIIGAAWHTATVAAGV